MNLTQSQIRGVHVLSCSGELALDKGDRELPAAVQAAVDGGARHLVLDLVRLAWVDSAGVGAIVSCSKRAADRAAIVRIAASPGGPVRRILVATHLDEMFEVFDDVENAVRGFG